MIATNDIFLILPPQKKLSVKRFLVGTYKKISQYNDNRIKYVYQENGGVSSARNKGICTSNGEFICFLDSDDEWKENHLEVLSELIERYEDCGMYITGYDIGYS